MSGPPIIALALWGIVFHRDRVSIDASALGPSSLGPYPDCDSTVIVFPLTRQRPGP
jgi:hypothetical protein